MNHREFFLLIMETIWNRQRNPRSPWLLRPKLLTFSFHRSADAPLFEDDDRRVQELIMPHVAAAWHANWLHHFEGMHAGSEGRARALR